MGNTIDFDKEQPHITSMVICLECRTRWIAVRPIQTKLQELECPGCSRTKFTIETGERLEA